MNTDHFDWKFYCNYYGDLRSAGINSEKKALEHYSQHGKNENRIINSDSAPHLTISSSNIPVDPLDPACSSSFFQPGQQFCNYLTQVGKLKKTDRVLEIGFGVGSLALALNKYLQSSGSYSGLDTDKNCVDWCRSKISSINSNFDFKYFPEGCQTIPFPYDNNSFDFVFSSIAFTSLSIDDAKYYLEEISRVLKVGGKCLILCFLWNPCIELLIRDGRCPIKTTDNLGECRNIHNSIREKAICYGESCVFQWHENNYLSIIEINYGNWSSSSTETNYQDYILSQKIKPH